LISTRRLFPRDQRHLWQYHQSSVPFLYRLAECRAMFSLSDRARSSRRLSPESIPFLWRVAKPMFISLSAIVPMISMSPLYSCCLMDEGHKARTPHVEAGFFRSARWHSVGTL
jgi:hypothetical protein